MFAVIYSFKVKMGHDQKFIDSWEGLTKLIHEYEGSQGSRLHQMDHHYYIAYAQWPDKATWENSGKKLPAEAEQYRDEMRSACEKITTTHELKVISDLLK